jgi:hypothetical protein
MPVMGADGSVVPSAHGQFVDMLLDRPPARQIVVGRHRDIRHGRVFSLVPGQSQPQLVAPVGVGCMTPPARRQLPVSVEVAMEVL